MTKTNTGYLQALQNIKDTISPVSVKEISLQDGLGCVAGEEIRARADSPSADASLKDGYALMASDIMDVSENNPARLDVIGRITAGQDRSMAVRPGTAVRILTGAPVPAGADTVVAEEFVSVFEDHIMVILPTQKGKNILLQGEDTKKNELLVEKGTVLTPGMIGFLASGGCSRLRVYQKPSIAIIATGDEIILPGQPLTPGKLYASNLLTLNSWCRRYGMETSLDIAKDRPDDLKKSLKNAIEKNDAVITSGGAWTGDKDMVANTLLELGWKKQFHRLRLGPGKAAGFGFLDNKPVFILPGGPPSNLVSFLMLALPGLLKFSGLNPAQLPVIRAKLAAPVSSKKGWTHAEFGKLDTLDSGIFFKPTGKSQSRLKSMADAHALLLVPEESLQMTTHETVMVYDLRT